MNESTNQTQTMYTVTISETIEGEDKPTLRYSQTLDAINLPAIIAAVNSKPPRVRNRSKAAGPQNTRKRASKTSDHLGSSLGLLSEEAK